MIKKKLLIFITVVLTAIPMCFAYAASGVYDEADMLYDTEIAALKTEAESLSKLTGWDVAVVTTMDTNGESSVVFADDYYYKLNFGDNGILYLLDMYNREIYISTAGESAEYITDSRLDNIFNEAVEYASAGSYYKSMSVQLSMTADYYNAGIPVDSSVAAAKMSTLAAAFIIGLIAAFMSVRSVKKSYGFNNVEQVYEYNSKSSLNLSVNSDRMINSFVTTRIRPRPKNNSGPRGGAGMMRGGSSMHRASSGRMHGGGGRKF